MANKTITSANIVLTINVPDVLATPITIQQFGTDEAVEVDAIDIAETMIGVDGKMSAGLLPAITPMKITLQADSDSISLFETWDATQKATGNSLLFATNAVYIQPGTKKIYNFTKGALKNIARVPSAKKVLQQVTFLIHWESFQVSPFA